MESFLPKTFKNYLMKKISLLAQSAIAAAAAFLVSLFWKKSSKHGLRWLNSYVDKGYLLCLTASEHNGRSYAEFYFESVQGSIAREVIRQETPFLPMPDNVYAVARVGKHLTLIPVICGGGHNDIKGRKLRRNAQEFLYFQQLKK